MSTLIVSPGTTYPVLTLSIDGVSGDLDIPMLQDVTINNANDVFTWTQLNSAGKNQVATTSTNSISANVVLDDVVFFGDATATTDSAEEKGLLELSTEKTRVAFSITMGSKTVTGYGYITGLAPTVSADSPVWTTPVTVTVDGEYTFS